MHQENASATIRRAILTGHILNYEAFGAFLNIEICDQTSNRHAVLACTISDDEVVPQYAYLAATPTCELLVGDLFSEAEIKAIAIELTLQILSESELEPELRLAA